MRVGDRSHHVDLLASGGVGAGEWLRGVRGLSEAACLRTRACKPEAVAMDLLTRLVNLSIFSCSELHMHCQLVCSHVTQFVKNFSRRRWIVKERCVRCLLVA